MAEAEEACLLPVNARRGSPVNLCVGKKGMNNVSCVCVYWQGLCWCRLILSPSNQCAVSVRKGGEPTTQHQYPASLHQKARTGLRRQAFCRERSCHALVLSHNAEAYGEIKDAFDCRLTV
jgi:hypothetical protein